MRARRLVAVALATLGVISLAACAKSEPGVAAYVGDTAYSVKRVDAIYQDAQTRYGDAVRDQAGQAGVTPSPEDLRALVTRQDVVNLLVSLDLGKRVAAAENLSVPDSITPQQLAGELRMPPEAEFVKLWAEWLDLNQALSSKLPPAEVSDASLMAVYHAIEKTGGIQPGLTVEQVRQAFGEGAFVRSATALSAALQAEGERAGTTINPMYRPVGLPSAVSNGQQLIFYALPYVDEDGPVTDISKPESASPAPAI